MEDTIRRSDAIKALIRMGGIKIDKALAMGEIRSIPSADRPQGEWIDAEIPLESGGSMPIQVCNLCKTFYPLAYTGGGHRFCPNCGARMKGADDE
jgi:hypothetical protein